MSLSILPYDAKKETSNQFDAPRMFNTFGHMLCTGTALMAGLQLAYGDTAQPMFIFNMCLHTL